MNRERGLPVSFACRRPPPGCQVRRVPIAPGAELGYEPGDWADALVVVEEGEIEVECLRGSLARFAAGALLYLDRVPVRWLRNAGDRPVVLSVLSRIAPAGAPGTGPQNPDSGVVINS